MKIELLYFDACPSWETALANLREVLDEAGADTPIEVVRVETPDEAVARQFTGSPSIRVDGRELFPTGQANYTLSCRMYHTPEGLRGWPTRPMIREALAAQGA